MYIFGHNVIAEQNAPSVAILLSTYNGHRFIGEQLDSLLAQDYPVISIYVRDDGSTDNTPEIVRAYANREPSITFTEGKNLGCIGSFYQLLGDADADIFMFCDQDDIWLARKVSSAVATLVDAGLHRPVMYHTDLLVVDEKLKTLADSFMAQQGLRMPQAHELEVLALQNCVVGCTVAMTAELVRRAKLSIEVVDAAAMHDWWLAMYARCIGTLIYSPEVEILYRQHGANVSGAIRRSLLDRIRLQFTAVGLKRINAYRRKVSRQASEFLNRYGDELNLTEKKILRGVSNLEPKLGFLPVVRGQLSGIRFQNTYMNVALLFSAAVTRVTNLLCGRTK